MASITHHRNKKTGAIYRYAVESYWDKEKKSPRNKQVCLGRVDPETGELIPSKRRRKKVAGTHPESSPSDITARSRIVGPNMILEKITREYGVDSLLDTCFGKIATKMQSLVYFLVQKGLALSELSSGVWLHCILLKIISAAKRLASCSSRSPKMTASVFSLCGWRGCLKMIICAMISHRFRPMQRATNIRNGAIIGTANRSSRLIWLCSLAKPLGCRFIIAVCLETLLTSLRLRQLLSPSTFLAAPPCI